MLGYHHEIEQHNWYPLSSIKQFIAQNILHIYDSNAFHLLGAGCIQAGCFRQGGGFSVLQKAGSIEIP